MVKVITNKEYHNVQTRGNCAVKTETLQIKIMNFHKKLLPTTIASASRTFIKG